MRKFKLFLTALAVMVTSVAFAQSLTVTGNVTDAATGDPVPFASVHEKGTMNGLSTDVDGHYSITVSKNAVLVFSSVGYESVEVAVAGKAQINCELPVDSETLDNAVVIGYGSAKKVGTVIGSVTTVKSDAIKNAPSSSALDQLQGQVAGLAVMTTGGVAGDNNVSMTLHGKGSLTSSGEPLYIIDGIQSSSRAIQSMNPNDILSVTVLKDASATSIYGSRAANGVVVVTTKAGSYDADATITVRTQGGISTLADKTLYENMMSGPELKEFWVRAGIVTPDAIKTIYTDNGFDADTKWYNYMQRFNNPQLQSDVTVEGGGNKVAYMIGASQFYQRGTAIGNDYTRYTVRSNVQGRPKEWLKVGANIAFSYDRRNDNPAWGDSSGSSNYVDGGLSYLINPLYPAIDPETGKVFEVMFPTGSTNPEYFAEKLTYQSNRYGLLGSFNVEIEPIRNLKISSRAGVDGNFALGVQKRMPSFVQSIGNGWRYRTASLYYNATLTNTIEYSFDLGLDHHFTLLAGHEGVATNSDAFSAYSEGIKDDRLANLQEGNRDYFDVSESMAQTRYLSFFGRIDYGLMEKYYFDASIRNDACSRFGPDNKSATFWAAGAMWRIKREDFLRDAYWLTDLNAKVSYGTQGNSSIGDYQYYSLIGESAKYYNESSWVVAQPSNYKLTWEKQALLTVGLSGRLIDRIDFNLEYYHRTTSSMLMSVPYSYTTGFSSLYDNVGSLLNTGFDITLGVDILSGRDHYLRFNTTFNYNKEKITSLFNGLDRWEITGTGIAYVVDKPVMYYAPIYAGIDPEDGRQMWYVPGDDPDVTTTDNGTTKVYDVASLTQNTGKARRAPVYGGFSFAGGWRGISLQADFSYVLGKTLINNDKFFYANPYMENTSTQHKDVADFWTPENTDAAYPDWSKGEVMQLDDTHLMENADFLRLKNLQIAYSFPERLLRNQNVVKGFKVSFTGRNLFTLTKYSGIDPEVDSNVSLGVVGNSKQYLFGIELSF